MDLYVYIQYIIIEYSNLWLSFIIICFMFTVFNKIEEISYTILRNQITEIMFVQKSFDDSNDCIEYMKGRYMPINFCKLRTVTVSLSTTPIYITNYSFTCRDFCL